MTTLLRCVEANSMKNENFESFLASDLDHLFSKKQCHIIYNILASLSGDCTGEYWPSVVFVQTSMRWVRTATTLAQYCPSQPSRSVSKRLLCLLLTLRCQRVELKEKKKKKKKKK